VKKEPFGKIFPFFNCLNEINGWKNFFLAIQVLANCLEFLLRNFVRCDFDLIIYPNIGLQMN